MEGKIDNKVTTYEYDYNKNNMRKVKVSYKQNEINKALK